MSGLTEKQRQEIIDAINKNDMLEFNIIFDRIIEEDSFRRETEKDKINEEFNKVKK